MCSVSICKFAGSIGRSFMFKPANKLHEFFGSLKVNLKLSSTRESKKLNQPSSSSKSTTNNNLTRLFNLQNKNNRRKLSEFHFNPRLKGFSLNSCGIFFISFMVFCLHFLTFINDSFQLTKNEFHAINLHFSGFVLFKTN